MSDKLVRVDHLRMGVERSAGLATQIAATAAAEAIEEAIEELDGMKQDKLTGTAGQFVGFDAAGNATAQAAPSIPAGAIVMWSGPTAPAGWTLCDGTNGTPALQDQGASLKYIMKL